VTGGRLGYTSGWTRQQRIRIIIAIAVAWLGLWAHELYRVPSAFGLTVDGSLPLLAIAVALLAWRLLAAHMRAPAVALLVYALINFVGGILSVLPLPFLPFTPEQTADHYLIHAMYAVCQIPMIAMAFSSSKSSLA
jgi:hypothetical protein